MVFCRFLSEVPKKSELCEIVSDLKAHIEPLNMKSVFSHNDILLNNVVVSKTDGKIAQNSK